MKRSEILKKKGIIEGLKMGKDMGKFSVLMKIKVLEQEVEYSLKQMELNEHKYMQDLREPNKDSIQI